MGRTKRIAGGNRRRAQSRLQVLMQPARRLVAFDFDSVIERMHSSDGDFEGALARFDEALALAHETGVTPSYIGSAAKFC
jgi:hypothetical protein